jgi:O-antigen biosynthesis protein WbqV
MNLVFRGSLSKRAALVLALDVLLAAASYYLSIYLRVGDRIFEWSGDVLWFGGAVFAVTATAVFLWFRLPQRVWRHASLEDIGAIVKAVATTDLVFLLALFLATRLDDFPRSVPVINLFVLTGLLAAPRLVYRIVRDRDLGSVLARDGGSRVPVLLAGWSDAAELFARHAGRGEGGSYRLVGVIDDRLGGRGRRVHGVDVLGTLADLRPVVDRLTAADDPPQRIVIGAEDIRGETLTKLVDAAEQLALPVSRLPSPDALQPGREGISGRPIQVEDLLGRPQRILDRTLIARLIAGRRVLVTGAGGTIGGELARQIAELGPRHLTLLDNGEFLLYAIDLEITERFRNLSRRPILGDVRDKARIDEIFRDERPDLVFHAAAFKHVPLVEANPDEGVLTNAIGTRIVADAARASGARAMVLISTDKAVNPSSVMGASKRIAESYCQALDVLGSTTGGTRFVTVRFGNVLGSTGSVVPLFRRQIERGGPVTVTDPKVARYFMTVREAVELVLHATELATETGDRGTAARGAIHVLEMGEPIRIVDLARRMIRLAGHRSEDEIEIVFTGLRPGEKLEEELFYDSEQLLPTGRPGILRARPRVADHSVLARTFDELESSIQSRRTSETVAAIRRAVLEFNAEALPAGNSGDR